MADGDLLILGLGSNASNAATELNRAGRIKNTALTVRNGNGAAIEGQASGFSAALTGRAESGSGVHGLSTSEVGVFGQSAPFVGVLGYTQENSGVVGYASPHGDGVVGAAEGTGHGVVGWAVDQSGVFGTAAASPGVGVDGTSPSVGVRGTGGKTGVLGQGQGTGTGVEAVAANNDALVATSSSNRGVVGSTLSGSGVGVHGRAFPPGAAAGTGHTGVMGSTAAGYGILGTANTGYAGGFMGQVIVWGALTVVGGTKSAAVPHPDGTHRLTYCTESPESWFEDFGRARLVGGRAEVLLDPDFAAIVRTEDYHVFLTPEGNTEGLYVSQRSADGFEVLEQRGGASDATFSYRVVTRRRDVDAARLAVVQLPEVPEIPQAPEAVPPEAAEAPPPPRKPALPRLSETIDVKG
jgi:hypothetical protein